MKKLLIVVDMQNDFIGGALGSEAARRAVPAVSALIERERAAGTEIVFTRDTHGDAYLQTQEGRRLPVPHCIRGTEGHEIVNALSAAAERATVFDKEAFGSVALAEYARAGGYGEIAFCGVCTDICVVSNALLVKAYCPEARICVFGSACAGTSAENHRAALAVMKSCQIEIV